MLTPMTLALALACQPPPEIQLGDNDTGTTQATGEPTINIVYPPNDIAIPLNDDCSFSTVVVVDVDHFELVEFGAPEEGEGHWHLQIDGEAGYSPVQDQYGELFRPAGTFIPPTLVLMTATLSDGVHNELGDAPPFRAAVEFPVEAPASGAACDTTP